MKSNIFIKDRANENYITTWDAMRAFVDNRNEKTADEIWLVEHPPVFTLGQNGKMEHVLNAGDIPVIHVDRGGQVTYHGPGQLVVYVMFDLKRHNLNVRSLVSHLEQAIITYLARYNITAHLKEGAPGVFVDNQKIASLGLRIRRGYSYHGLSFNVNMDLSPFKRINPCGYQHLVMTQLSDLGGPNDLAVVKPLLIENILQELFI